MSDPNMNEEHADSHPSENETETDHSSNETETDTNTLETELSHAVDEEEQVASMLELEIRLEELKTQRLELETSLHHVRETREFHEQTYLSEHDQLPYANRDVPVSEQIETLEAEIEETRDQKHLETLRIERLKQIRSRPDIREMHAMAAGSIDLAGFHEGLRRVFNGDLDTSEGRLHVNAKTSTGQTPLHLVVQGCVEADFPLPDSDNANAIRDRRTKVMLLLCMGADPNAQDDKGNTTLHSAVEDPCKDESIVQLLLAHGADPFLANVNQKTPIHIAKAFAVRAILGYEDAAFQSQMENAWTPELFSSMDLFTQDPRGASEIMHEMFQRLV